MPQTLEQILSDWTRSAFTRTFPDTDLSSVQLDVAVTTEDGYGDYQCNAAMGLARILKQAPRAIAQAVVEQNPPPDSIERIEIAGPGFINLHVNPGWLNGHLEGMAADRTRLGVPAVGAGRTVVLDYSAPNIAKQMHVGHIRSTVIGNALDRMHRFLGWNVISDNHVGDWGTQFGVLILGYRHLLDEAALASDPVTELERIYVASYARAKEDDAWMDRARGELVKLQQGDPDNRAIWDRFLELSRGEFDSIYERLGVTFDLTRGESYYNDRLSGLLDRMQAAGIAVESEGALVVHLEEEKLPVCIVRKSDGAANYATTDLATIESRVEEFDPVAIVYVTDERQQTHFRQVFAVARRMAITTRFDHVWYGLMRLPEGTFSSREGNVIKLHALLDEAEARALVLVQESRTEMADEQQRDVARAVGIGAVKYADLSQNPQSLVTFSWDKALALDGNSAPYLQYAYARIASVRDKYAERFPGQDLDERPIRLGEPVEVKLGLLLARFPEAVMRAAQQYKPNLLADYLYELAQTYSRFYQNVPFLKAEDGVRESRVRVCGLVARTLREGLHLLGIETPERI